MAGGGQFGEFKVVGGKEGEALGLVVQPGGNGGGQRQAVIRAGAAPDFVHEHQRLRRGAAQDLRRFGHLQHEGGLGVGQIVGRADAGVNGVYRPQAAAFGGHVAAHAGQQGDEGHLPHVGAFAAHVGAGDDLQALARPQVRAVGNESALATFLQARLHDGVAACGDVNARLAREFGPAPLKRVGALGQGG